MVRSPAPVRATALKLLTLRFSVVTRPDPVTMVAPPHPASKTTAAIRTTVMVFILFSF
jgi:hypothetical protein